MTPDSSGSPPRPIPLRLTGLIDEIDVAGQCLRIGSHTVEIPGSVSLDGLRAGDRVVVRAMRDPASGRIRALEVVSAGPQLGPAPPETDSAPRRILSLVAGLLVELSRDARVLDCELVPEIDRYAIRIDMHGRPVQTVLMPRHVLEVALDDPVARRTVRSVLQAAVTLLRDRRAVSAVRREVPRPDVREQQAWPGPRCVRCEGPLSSDDSIITEAGAHGHLACPPMW